MRQNVKSICTNSVPRKHVTVNTVMSVSIDQDFTRDDLIVKFPSGMEEVKYGGYTKYSPR